VKDDHQGRALEKAFGRIAPGIKTTGIGAKLLEGHEPAVTVFSEAEWTLTKSAKAADGVVKAAHPCISRQALVSPGSHK